MPAQATRMPNRHCSEAHIIVTAYMLLLLEVQTYHCPLTKQRHLGLTNKLIDISSPWG